MRIFTTTIFVVHPQQPECKSGTGSSLWDGSEVFGCHIKVDFPFVRKAEDEKIQNKLGIIDASSKFDVLLVDEAQDFWRSELQFLTTLIKLSGRVILFSDAEQNIFTDPREDGWDYDEKAIFDDGEPVEHQELTVNYRNAEPIHRQIQELGLDQTVPYWTASTLRETPKEVTRVPRSNLEAMISEVLTRMSPCQIVLLGYDKQVLDSVKTFTDSLGRQVKFVSEIQNCLHGDGILRMTVQGFKGIDAEAVFLLSDTAYSNNRLEYVGISRAKYELYIVE